MIKAVTSMSYFQRFKTNNYKRTGTLKTDRYGQERTKTQYETPDEVPWDYKHRAGLRKPFIENKIQRPVRYDKKIG